MIDEFAMRRDIERGMRAEKEMATPAIDEAFDILQGEYFEAWRASQIDMVASRERLWMACSIIEKVRGHLMSAIADGRIAQEAIRQIEEVPTATNRH